MYYLNDKHPKFEYCVYVRVGNACPYIMPRKFEDMQQVYRFISETEKNNNRYNRIFYIDNSFYKNNYSRNMNGIYYKILRRKINDWEEFDDTEKFYDWGNVA